MPKEFAFTWLEALTRGPIYKRIEERAALQGEQNEFQFHLYIFNILNFPIKNKIWQPLPYLHNILLVDNTKQPT